MWTDGSDIGLGAVNGVRDIICGPYAQRYAKFTLLQYLCMTVSGLTKLRFTHAKAVR